jgi:hypothetical protein
MQCGVETMNDCERSPGRQGLRVNFTEKGEVKERREKFLTAKYGSHQMSLIRKRLAVEMWLYDELQKLFDPPVSRRKCDMISDIALEEKINKFFPRHCSMNRGCWSSHILYILSP